MQGFQNASQSAPLFDVTSSFNQALSQARQERGEPDGGIARKIYDAKLWMRINSNQVRKIGLALIGASLLGGVATYVLRSRRARMPEFPMLQADLEKSEINLDQKTA